MSTLSTAARNAACNAVVDLFDGGTGAGKVVFQTSGDAEVATCPFSNPAFGDAATGTATANAITSDTSATGGTIDHASLQNGDGTEIMQLSCGTSGAEINMSSLSVNAEDTVVFSSLTITCDAS